MDLDTENRIASILLKEAAELRRQAQQEGVLAYLNKPTVRGRPNSRFLSATIRGIEQANRAVEVNEMWQARQKELEMDDRLKGRPRNEVSQSCRDSGKELSSSRSKSHDLNPSCSSSKRTYEDHNSTEDNSLRDEELQEFLQSRVKRGRGSIGSRMDETGPYLPRSSESQDGLCASINYVAGERHRRTVLGPEKPSSWKYSESSDVESDEDGQKRSKKASSGGSNKKHYKKHKSKDRSGDKKKKKKEKRHKY